MAYKIRYRSVDQTKNLKSKLRLFFFTLAFFALFVVMSMYFAPEQLLMLHNIVFGFDKVETLLQDLRDGEPIAQAVSAFCQGILNGK